VLKIGDKFFGGFSGKTAADGKSLTKIRNGLTEAKLVLPQNLWVPLGAILPRTKFEIWIVLD